MHYTLHYLVNIQILLSVWLFKECCEKLFLLLSNKIGFIGDCHILTLIVTVFHFQLLFVCICALSHLWQFGCEWQTDKQNHKQMHGFCSVLTLLVGKKGICPVTPCTILSCIVVMLQLTWFDWFDLNPQRIDNVVGRQEGHPFRKKLGVGLSVVTFWLELCTSYSSSCYRHLHHP